MAKIERLADSGAQGKAASLVCAAPTGSPPHRGVTANTHSGVVRVCHWQIDEHAVSLTSTHTLNHAASQLDLADIGVPVVAYREQSEKTLRLAVVSSNAVHAAGNTIIDDRRVAIARGSYGVHWFVAYSANDELRLQQWTLAGQEGAPSLSLLASSGDQAGSASHIAMVSRREDSAVVAARTGGSLKLISWRAADGHIQRLGDSGDHAGAVSEVAIAAFSGLDYRASPFIVTPVRNDFGNLEIITWRESSSLGLQRVDTAVAGAISEVAVATFEMITGENLGVFVTAVRNGHGNLELISWRVHENGNIHRLASATAGAAHHVDIFPVASDIMATTCIDDTGREKVIAWRVQQNALIPG